MAERTGLEPATPCVTGRYSNQLNYRSAAVCSEISEAENGAGTKSRTRDLLITSQLLYQLSYTG